MCIQDKQIDCLTDKCDRAALFNSSDIYLALKSSSGLSTALNCPPTPLCVWVRVCLGVCEREYLLVYYFICLDPGQSYIRWGWLLFYGANNARELEHESLNARNVNKYKERWPVSCLSYLPHVRGRIQKITPLITRCNNPIRSHPRSSRSP